MKRSLVVAAASLMLMVSYGTSQAVPYDIQMIPDDGVAYTYENSGLYLGTVIGENDSAEVIEGALAQLGYVVDITSSSKVDAGEDWEGNFPLFVTYADPDGDGGFKSGTWSTGTPPAALVSFYSVKAANDFALYLVSPAAGSGSWNCENLRTPNGRNTPAISHFSGVGTVTDVPEPGTLLLLGSGLLGIGLMRRKRHTA